MEAKYPNGYQQMEGLSDPVDAPVDEVDAQSQTILTVDPISFIHLSNGSNDETVNAEQL